MSSGTKKINAFNLRAIEIANFAAHQYQTSSLPIVITVVPRN